MSIEAMKQALEALEIAVETPINEYLPIECSKAITALRCAISEYLVTNGYEKGGDKLAPTSDRPADSIKPILAQTIGQDLSLLEATQEALREHMAEIKRLRGLLEQAQPVQAESITDAMMYVVDRLGSEFDQVDPRAWQHMLVYAPKQHSTEQAQPVAWMVEFENGEQELHFDEQSVGETQTPLYTAPPSRKPLTEAFLEKLAEKHVTDCYFDTLTYARAVEAAHSIKEEE